MPKPRGRPKGRRNDPPVSLSPLEPEEALAGLLQVKPEKEQPMPSFKHEDRVRVVAGEYAGQTGTVFANPNIVRSALAPVGEGQDIAGEERLSYIYEVDLDKSDEPVMIPESDLNAI